MIGKVFVRLEGAEVEDRGADGAREPEMDRVDRRACFPAEGAEAVRGRAAPSLHAVCFLAHPPSYPAGIALECGRFPFPSCLHWREVM